MPKVAPPGNYRAGLTLRTGSRSDFSSTLMFPTRASHVGISRSLTLTRFAPQYGYFAGFDQPVLLHYALQCAGRNRWRRTNACSKTPAFAAQEQPMAMRADDLIDRRRLRRKLTFWRVAATRHRRARRSPSARWMLGDDLGGSRLPTTSPRCASRARSPRTRNCSSGWRRSARRRPSRASSCRSIRRAAQRPAARRSSMQCGCSPPKSRVVAQVGTLAASAGYMIASAIGPHRRAQIVDRRLDRRAGAVSRRHRADGQGRHQARGGEVLAAEGRAFALQPDHRARSAP